jgi:hypothetical protein
LGAKSKRRPKIRALWLYDHLKEPAQGVKVLLQMIVGVVGSFIVIVIVAKDVHGGSTAIQLEGQVLVIIATEPGRASRHTGHRRTRRRSP